VGTDAQLALAKKYGRDDKTANSHNYANGVMVAQVAAEVILRAKAKGLKITKENLYAEMLAMNGMNAFYPVTTVGPVTYSEDRQGRCRHPAAVRGQRWCLPLRGRTVHP
jgi:branched-chain amino acid transport system substrate-binding protein